jgi:hypothetical protein
MCGLICFNHFRFSYYDYYGWANNHYNCIVHINATADHDGYTMGDFKVGVSVGVCCTKCTLNTCVNTNFEITQCTL